MTPPASRPAVLLTGGAGYIGSHAAKRLWRAGFLPVAYDDLSAGRREFVRWGPLEVGSLADEARLAEAIARHAPVAALHFAARASVEESVRDPGRYYRDNVAGTLCLLEALRAAGVRLLVFSSTCAVYGEPGSLPVDEDAPLLPTHPYGRSKRMAEEMLADYGRAHGLESIRLRYFNAAGADAGGELGESRDPETHLIPLALDAAAGLRPSVRLYGTSHPTPDGTCVRDYVHVEDLADAHLLALEHLLRGRGPLDLNLGTGVGYSVREILRAAERITGRDIPVELHPARAGDPPWLVADGARARRILGWRPRRGLWDILDSAWKWHCARQANG